MWAHRELGACRRERAYCRCVGPQGAWLERHRVATTQVGGALHPVPRAPVTALQWQSNREMGGGSRTGGLSPTRRAKPVTRGVHAHDDGRRVGRVAAQQRARVWQGRGRALENLRAGSCGTSPPRLRRTAAASTSASAVCAASSCACSAARWISASSALAAAASSCSAYSTVGGLFTCAQCRLVVAPAGGSAQEAARGAWTIAGVQARAMDSQSAPSLAQLPAQAATHELP